LAGRPHGQVLSGICRLRLRCDDDILLLHIHCAARDTRTLVFGSSLMSCHAIQAGSKARELLASRETAGKVLAAVSGAIYLSARDDEVFWIGVERLPLHRRCVTVPRLPPVGSGDDFVWKSPLLSFSSSFVDISSQKEWASPGLKSSGLVSLPEFRAGFRQLLGALDPLKLGEGMGTTISLTRAMVEGGPFPNFPRTSTMAKAMGVAPDLACACLNHDLDLVMRIGRDMIGLGPGLTPSGDDFLGGLLFAARFVHQSCLGELSWDEDAVVDLLDWAKTRTHPISCAIFSDLALGHGPEPLHDLIGGLLEGRGFNRILEAALRVAAIGHSSGWDILAGAAMGMLMVRKRVPRSSRVKICAN
jgi:hypothetical protein